MALALVEAGARSVYCLDLPKPPGEEWTKVNEFAKKLKKYYGWEEEDFLAETQR